MKQIIAMHGWYSDKNSWKNWYLYFKNKGWHWQSGERGYGKLQSHMPDWKQASKGNSAKKHVLICHSLGFHLIGNNVLADATDIILLCSFSNFIPKGKEMRGLKVVLKGMQKALGTNREKAMFKNFLLKANHPNQCHSFSKELLKEDISQTGREKLAKDLSLLINTQGLPKAISKDARVLVVNGEKDQIIDYSAKADLIRDLKQCITTKIIRWDIENEGHFIASENLMKRIENWINFK